MYGEVVIQTLFVLLNENILVEWFFTTRKVVLDSFEEVFIEKPPRGLQKIEKLINKLLIIKGLCSMLSPFLMLKLYHYNGQGI